MSKEMLLVPLTEWKRLKAQRQESTIVDEKNDDDDESRQKQRTVVKVLENEPNIAPNKENIIDLLPKAYRSRARIILHYLSKHLNADNRLIYDDGRTSSHLIDLLKYVLNPLSQYVPDDGDKFISLMKKSGVPDSVYGSRIAVASALLPWLSLDN